MQVLSIAIIIGDVLFVSGKQSKKKAKRRRIRKKEKRQLQHQQEYVMSYQNSLVVRTISVTDQACSK